MNVDSTVLMTLKEKIHQHYLHVLQDKIAEVQHNLNDLTESLQNETKSTAGDKHETARAFVHIEQANVSRQLEELQSKMTTLQSLPLHTSNEIVAKGSLVLTSKGYLYVSVALGKALVDDVTVFALSAASPLGNQLMGLHIGGIATVNGNRYKVEEIN